MAMVVQHNITAMNSNRMLGVTTSAQAKSTEKLSSGYKINRAADDAAGLAISEKMRKQIKGLTQASDNAQDGISAVQTAEGALAEVHDMLQRMNQLAVKSANGTNSESDREAIQAEVNQLVTEIDRVSTTTKFNETYLLKGTNAGEVGKLSYETANGGTSGITFEDDGLFTTDAVETAELSGDGLDDTNTKANGKSFTVGDNTYVLVESTEQDDEDGDPAISTAEAAELMNKAAAEDDPQTTFYYTSMDALLQGVKSSDSANIKEVSTESTAEGLKLKVAAFADQNDPLDVSLHVGADSTADNKISLNISQMSARYLGVNGLDVSGDKADNATAAIDTIAAAIQKVSDQRASLGAVQNRLEHTIKNLDNVVENTTSAESAIRDTDMAEEMVTYSKNNILAQAGQSMLAQANQSNQGVLSLLG